VQLLERHRSEIGRIRGQAHVHVGAPPDQPAGGDKATPAVPARSREDPDPAAANIAAEHHAREPRQVRAGVLHHPSQRQSELHRHAVDVAHLRDADPRDRARGTALNHYLSPQRGNTVTPKEVAAIGGQGASPGQSSQPQGRHDRPKAMLIGN
jgi:hypothetical protein